MPEQNPYSILNVSPEATTDEVEDAYDALFDAYEPQARAGDTAAVDFLHGLNAARETLVDPQARAEVDAGLRKAKEKVSLPVAAASQASQVDVPRRTGSKMAGANASPRRGSAPSARINGTTVRVRPRSSNASRAVQQETNTRRLPLLIAGTLLLVLLGAMAVFLLLRPNDATQAGAPVASDPSRGEVLASVNGVPIYQDDWQARFDIDKQGALSDPLFAPFVNNFQGITGTRMLDILSYDSMDKLINFEIIQQQAKKEGLYPTKQQQDGLISDAKKQDLKNGQAFEQFLKDKKITSDRYNRTVIQNVVYTVMANEHMPKTGTAEARSDGFLKWICDTRKSYDVKIYRKFTVAENQPCTSGLPTDLPLPGLPTDQQGTTVPGDVPTIAVPISPKATP